MKRIIVLLLLLLPVLSCGKKSTDEKLHNIGGQRVEEIILFDFLYKNMTSPEGVVYTNYKNSDNIDILPKGHELLSETVGLQMLYYLYTNNKSEFDRLYRFTKDTLQGDRIYIMWRYHNKVPNLSNSSATLDDMRIAKALYFAHEKWQDTRYIDYFNVIRSNLETYALNDGYLADIYDDYGKSATVELSYLDLQTMNIFSKYNNLWDDVYKKSLKLLNRSISENIVPMPLKNYNLKTNTFGNYEKLNLIESLYSVYFLALVGELNIETIDYIKKDLLKDNKIYAYINFDGTTNTLESSAVYGLIMRIAKVLGDIELYNLAYNRVVEFQVKDKYSNIYGSFDSGDHVIYSFDNLQVLLGLNDSYIK